MSFLYIVATPIGNLEDLSFRALKTLRGVDLILAEDTRVTKKLLFHYQIKTPLLSYHQHSKLQKTDYILKLLKEGKNLALVSDAGTPGISDPGGKLVAKMMESLNDRVIVAPIPGPSALIAAASISGFNMDRFLFLGFPPHKNKRKKFFKEVLESKYPVIFYESPYRILKTLGELSVLIQDTKYKIPDTRLVVCQELTKMFERTYRGRIDQVIEKMKKENLKGEFVVIVSNESPSGRLGDQKLKKDE